ncbi:MAG TPA: hypothetical protein VFS10_09425 [Pyrinomonadaceae bacterium]|nr:hypothetical protein [Pyrinomonadaceae bacterium]
MRSNLSLRVVAAALVACAAYLITNVSSSAQVPTALPGQVIISELRFRGPEGLRDEYIELYNNTDSLICVQASDTSPGWAVAISGLNAAGQPITGNAFTIPNGTCIPARGHLLGANNEVGGYSLSGYPAASPSPTGTPAPSPTPFVGTTPDRTFLVADVPDGVGVALFTTTSTINQNAATRLDAFGFTNSPALFKEGNGFPVVPAVGTEHALYRDLRPGGFHKDTNDNASDFLFVQTSTSIQPTLLGAPGPENLSSPIVNNNLTGNLLDPARTSSQSPNRERNLQPVPNGDFGTLVIRRTITNNTGLPVTRLRFRVINITGPGTENTCGGTLCADVRALSSSDGTATLSNQTVVPVRGVRLEEPPSQPNGGGFNSSVSADFITLTTPLAPGQSVNVQFTLGVMRTGTFRHILSIEALTGSPPIILSATMLDSTSLP